MRTIDKDMRKFSTGGDEVLQEEETFKNKTLRFTNNNFVANNRKDSNTFQMPGVFDTNQQRKDASPVPQKEFDDPEDSIEEDIVTSQNETPQLGGGHRKHGKAAGLYPPPLAPKQNSTTSTNKLKFAPPKPV